MLPSQTLLSSQAENKYWKRSTISCTTFRIITHLVNSAEKMERRNVEAAPPQVRDQRRLQELSLEEKFVIAPSICEHERGCVKRYKRMSTGGVKGRSVCDPCRYLFHPDQQA